MSLLKLIIKLWVYLKRFVLDYLNYYRLLLIIIYNNFLKSVAMAIKNYINNFKLNIEIIFSIFKNAPINSSYNLNLDWKKLKKNKINKTLVFNYFIRKFLLFLLFLFFIYFIWFRIDLIIFINFIWLNSYLIFIDFIKSALLKANKTLNLYSAFRYITKIWEQAFQKYNTFIIYMPPIFEADPIFKIITNLRYMKHPWKKRNFQYIYQYVFYDIKLKLELKTLNKISWWFRFFPDLFLILKIYNEFLIKFLKNNEVSEYINELYHFLIAFFLDYPFYLKNFIIFFFNFAENLGLHDLSIFYQMSDWMNIIALLLMPFIYYMILFYQLIFDLFFWFFQDFFINSIKLRNLDLEFVIYIYIYIKEKVIFTCFYKLDSILNNNSYLNLIRSFLLYILEYNKNIIIFFKRILFNIYNFEKMDFQVLTGLKTQFSERYAMVIETWEKKNLVKSWKLMKKLAPNEKPIYIRSIVPNTRSFWISAYPSSNYKYIKSNLNFDSIFFSYLPNFKFFWISLGEFFDNHLLFKFKIKIFENFWKVLNLIFYLLVIFFIFGILLLKTLKNQAEFSMNELSYKLYSIYMKTKSNLNLIFDKYWEENFKTIIKKSFFVDDTFYDRTKFLRFHGDPVIEMEKKAFFTFYFKVMSSISRPKDRYSKFEKLNLKYRILRIVDAMVDLNYVYVSYFKAFYKYRFFRFKHSKILNFFIYRFIKLYAFILYLIVKFELIENIYIYISKLKIYKRLNYNWIFIKNMFIISNSNLIFFGDNLNILLYLFNVERLYKTGTVFNCLAKLESNIDITQSFRKNFIKFNTNLISDVKILKFYKKFINFSFVLNKRLFKFFVYKRFNNIIYDFKTQVFLIYEKEIEAYFRKYISNNQFFFIFIRLIYIFLIFFLIIYDKDLIFNSNNLNLLEELLHHFFIYLNIYMNWLFNIIMFLFFFSLKIWEFLNFIYFVFSNFLTRNREVRDWSTMIYYKLLWVSADLKSDKFHYLLEIKYKKFMDVKNITDLFVMFDKGYKFDLLSLNLLDNLNTYYLDKAKLGNTFALHKFWIKLIYLKEILKLFLKTCWKFIHEHFLYGIPGGIFTIKEAKAAKSKLNSNLYEYRNEIEEINKLEPIFYDMYFNKKLDDMLKNEQIFVKSWIFRNKHTWNHFERSLWGEAILSYMVKDQWPPFILTLKKLGEFLNIIEPDKQKIGRWVDPFERVETSSLEDLFSYLKINKNLRLEDVINDYRSVMKKKWIFMTRSKFNSPFRESDWHVSKYLERPHPLKGFEKENPSLNVWDIYMDTKNDKMFERLFFFLQEILWRVKFIYHRKFTDPIRGRKFYHELETNLKNLFEIVHRDKETGVSKDWFKFKWNYVKWSKDYYSEIFVKDFKLRKLKEGENEKLSDFLLKYIRYNDNLENKLNNFNSKIKNEKIIRNKMEKFFTFRKNSLFLNNMDEDNYKKWKVLKKDNFDFVFSIKKDLDKERIENHVKRKNHIQRILIWQTISKVVRRTQIWRIFLKKDKSEDIIKKENKFFKMELVWNQLKNFINK